MVGPGINPFHYSGPVPPEELVDREEQRQALLDLTWSGNNARLAAPRRYGKTSLLRATLLRASAEGFTSVYVDFFGVLDLADVAARIEAAYGSQLDGRLRQWFTAARRSLAPVARVGGGPVPASLEVGARPGAGDGLTERLDLPRRLHQRDGRRVLVAFDEFQDVLATANADAVIRSVIQHHADVASYVFAGSQVALMQELFTDRRRAFFAQARPVDLRPLPPTDLGEFVADRFERTGRNVGAALGPLLDLAEGHPQRSMLLASCLWDATAPGRTADEEAWAEAEEAALRAVAEEAATIWAHLAPVERQVLTSIAEDLGGLYAQAGRNRRSGSTARAVEALVGGGEVVADPDRRTGYRVVDPLLARWLRAGRSL